ncbi:MAG TPA: tyrosine-protein phosphatase [Caulobacteraceae bacterium]|jgi:protein tyrosine/serine phosphatase|nr:tyrosine-protein phosphatase [Caulobacteraceae bacterium]
MQRKIPLEAVENFRDFGGYAVAGGGALRRGFLYRSASHARATDGDLETIGALGIGVVVDLRRLGEREREPSRRHSQFGGVVIHNDDDGRGDTWQEHIRTSDLSPEGFRRYLLEYYREAPFEPRHIDLYRRYFDALATADAPVLIHCAAGKDRTGLLAALTHRLAGVHADDILADYMASLDPPRMAKRTAVVRQIILETTGRTASDEALMVAMGVAPDYLAEAFAAVEREAGGVSAYLEGTLGVTPARRAAVLERIVV